mmetsp:Transcript_42324/g.83109  ORF Transcript_42324/g.83109 Transcript_42324/m.83109 type:complete len:242 (-) Transcript_42324:158-883(-)
MTVHGRLLLYKGSGDGGGVGRRVSRVEGCLVFVFRKRVVGRLGALVVQIETKRYVPPLHRHPVLIKYPPIEHLHLLALRRKVILVVIHETIRVRVGSPEAVPMVLEKLLREILHSVQLLKDAHEFEGGVTFVAVQLLAAFGGASGGIPFAGGGGVVLVLAYRSTGVIFVQVRGPQYCAVAPPVPISGSSSSVVVVVAAAVNVHSQISPRHGIRLVIVPVFVHQQKVVVRVVECADAVATSG